MKRTRTSAERRLAMHGFSLVEGGHCIHALLEFDITELRPFLRKRRREGGGGSLFAFMLKAIGKCLEDFPEFNAMIDLGHTTSFGEVDVGIPIEMESQGKVYNKQYIVRNVAAKSIAEISEEIELSKRSVDDQAGYVASPRLRRLLGILPRWIVLPLLRSVLKDHEKVRELSGTVFVTSVSMFSTVPGFIVPYAGGPKASSFAIGSTMKKPVVKDGELRIRELLNITASFNHDLIDGAPAARFINALRKYIEIDYGKIA